MKLFGPDLYTNILGWIVLVTFGLSIANLAMNLVVLQVIHR